ncbi:hypothetical protein GCM10022221_03390 [Actinocorallia aurea]
MAGRRRLGRRFGWLWAEYAVSAYGSGLGCGALPLIAVGPPLGGAAIGLFGPVATVMAVELAIIVT